jgi:hypothetical protein
MAKKTLENLKIKTKRARKAQNQEKLRIKEIPLNQLPLKSSPPNTLNASSPS